MRTVSIVATLAIMLTWTLPAGAADEPKADSPAPAAAKQPAEKQPAAKPGPQAEQFAKLFTEWKALLVDLNDMKVKFRSAEGQAKTDIEDRWKVQIAKATEMQDKLIEAAEKAYVESPEADANITDMLMGLVFTWNQHDDYEKSFRVAKLLLDNGCKDTNRPQQAGIAAFGIGEFDLAKKWLAAAGPAAQLSEAGQKAVMGQQYYSQVWAKEQKLREAEAKADDLPRVLLKTSKGEIEIELFENEAPNTVANFITLVDKGFYNGLKFHRVLEGFMAQGGCPKGDGTGGPGYNIPCECVKPEHRLHYRGTLSMAHAGRDTGGSQFFLCFVPLQMLDGKHTAFGRVVRGMDVLAKIRRIDPEQPTGVQPDKIIEAKVLRKRPHEYKVEKAAGRE